ncbi:MAG TPA: hypothetical protein VF532_17465 [Candidatus Angelobacter sp.]
MKATPQANVSRKMKQALERELHSHLETHLQADHFAHIRAAKAAVPAKPTWQAKRPAYRILGAMRIYSTTLAPAARAGLSEMQPGGWVLLVQSAGGLLAKVEMQQRDKHHFVARMSTGTVAEDLAAAIKKEGTASKQKSQELRFLSIPAMHIMAVWLHSSRNPKRDTITPISLNFAGLRPRRTYSRTTAEKALQQHATDLIVHWYERYQREGEQKAV